ncbi:MAG: response regulator [Magnetococcales bacterium]|nr:response regulator [Magnetococcales bacterium]
MNELIEELANPVVLIVDDEFLQRLPMREALEQASFRVLEAEDGRQAWAFIQRERPDLVLSDVVMPRMDGFSLCETIRHQDELAHLPVVLATSLDDVASIERAYQAGATDFITKPIHWGLIGHRVRYILRSARTAQALADRESALLRARLEIVRRLGWAAEYRDNETGQHILRMSQYAVLLGRAIGLSAHDQELLLNAAPMHDVGKIGIPDSILLKPGKLTTDEFSVMQTHTVLGGKLLDEEPSLLLRTAYLIALAHHERWDGKGYPFGLEQDDIPLMGRICSLADVFDALTSKRPYKEAWSVAQAVEEISRCSGTAFDPRLVQAFLDILPEIVQVKEAHADTEQTGSESLAQSLLLR